MEYIFNPERLGYLRYNLRNVVKLTSRYSYVLFLYLEQNRHMHLTWDVPLDELKALMRCTADSYKGYKEFNDKVLKKCLSELNDKTDCKFSYEPIKRGRTVKAVRFTLEPLALAEDILHGRGACTQVHLPQSIFVLITFRFLKQGYESEALALVAVLDFDSLKKIINPLFQVRRIYLYNAQKPLYFAFLKPDKPLFRNMAIYPAKICVHQGS